MKSEINKKNYLVDKYNYVSKWSEEDGAFVAKVIEFPGLRAHADSSNNAIEELKLAVTLVLESMEEKEMPFPKPISSQN
jgi:predicted RNase H-like HicB family nuclease